MLDVDGKEGHLVGFREKPVFEFLVSMGVYAFHKSIAGLIPKGAPFGCDMLWRKMLQERIPIRTYQFSGLWFDIGRPDDYDRVTGEFDKNAAAYLPWESQKS